MHPAPADTPSRHLKLDGTYNVRDVGGYATADGRVMRWRTLLRADSLHRLPEAGQRDLLACGVRTIIDLRRPNEARHQPNVFAASAALRYIHYPLYEITVDTDHDEPLRRHYRWLLDECQPQLAAVLTLLGAPGALPALIHCTAGKDRTGIVIALLLALAGVDRAMIAADYALSATYLTDDFVVAVLERVREANRDWERYQRLLICPDELMLDTLAYLDERYGGVGPYLRRCGLASDTLAALRAALTA